MNSNVVTHQASDQEPVQYTWFHIHVASYIKNVRVPCARLGKGRQNCMHVCSNSRKSWVQVPE